MNPEAQRIAIAASVGIYLHDGDHAPSDYMFITDLPDYLNDLNAMHKAEKSLTEVQFGVCYIEHLKTAMGESEYSIEHSIVCATAAQRAEAYLKTLGLFTDAADAAKTSKTDV